MPKKSAIPYVNTTRKPDGRVYYYHRPTGTRLPGQPGSPEFQSRLDDLNAQMERPDQAALRDAEGPRAAIPGSWRALFAEWQQHPDWLGLAPRTRALYQTHIDFVTRKWGDLPVGGTEREDCVALQDAISRPRQITRFVGGRPVAVTVSNTRKADTCIDVISTAFNFALDRPRRYGGLKYNPAFRMKRQHKAGIGIPRWPEAVIDVALARAPKELRRALIAFLYTGQRISDVAAMGWPQYDGEGIQVVTRKTRRSVWIPVHPALKAMLDEAWEENARRSQPSTTILLAPHNGQPWTVDWLKHSITRFMRAIGHPGYSAHGLRKAACARLVEAGCDDREGAEAVGMTVQMFQHYSKEVRQKQVAKRAGGKLAAFDPRRR
jgi:integrase